MCSRPPSVDGKTFACRTCNECIANRRHNWINRAMGEKTSHAHALCLALTYDETNLHNRDARQIFCYADVQAFLKRLRDACRRYAKKHRLNVSHKIRFLCAGEQGDRKGHVHWHMIIYSDLDLMKIGIFEGMKNRVKQVVTERRDMITTNPKKAKRLNWSIWGHGFVTLQEPDEGGMGYVLSYCLKDQFTDEKSQGTMREAKAENFATGLFRPSKRPAIGEDFLMRKMEELEASGSVLPNLNIKVPGCSGYWQPSGTFRKKLLWSLNALNKRRVWATGANAPQWSSLLASCSENPSDMEILLGQVVPPEENPNHDDHRSVEAEFIFRSGEYAQVERIRETRRTCGSVLPCNACLRKLAESDIERYGLERVLVDAPEFGSGQKFWLGEWVARDGYIPIEERQRTRSVNGLNPHCQRRCSKEVRLAFPASCGP